ncbi:hypothetical protein [Jeotgalicoccus sp. FSL K6-3177]|uniref:hypothetical protein n=1 Tax=Jeotgalicoccus sp. FSL K6-3177 TaxID=2921494 RepID=UPI0030FD62BD
MVHFDFHFLNSSIPLENIVIGILTVVGTAIATYLAAKYSGNIANNIAKNNNENLWNIENKNREIDTINNLYIAYNKFNIYVESFFDSKKDNERVNILNLKYDYSNNAFSYYKEEQFIKVEDINIEDSKKLGELIIEQTSDYSWLVIELQNQLLLSRKYFEIDKYKELESLINSYKSHLDYILNCAISLKSKYNPGYKGIARDLVYLNNRSIRIRYIYKNKGEFKLESDDDQNFEEPAILKYRYIYETHLKIENILNQRVNDI